MKKYQKYTLILCVIGLLLMLTGITYSFFNYTKTGAVNNVRTGNLYFSSTEGNALSLTNMFPMTSTEASNANLDSLTITLTGSTNYVDGEEFEVSIVDVNNTINGKEIPMNYIATYTPSTGGTIGTSSNDYWNDRNDKDATIYKLFSTGGVAVGKEILVGYIDDGVTGINGTLNIKAYIDADRIAISDTYYENAPSPTPTSPTDDYGTTSEWVDERIVLTSDEWNSLSSHPISFKVHVESNEGLWVGKIDTCPNCKFIYTNAPLRTTWDVEGIDSTTNEPIPGNPSIITSGLYDNYIDVVNMTGKNHFLGVILNEQNKATEAFACGIKNNRPFCLEGSLYPLYGGTQAEELFVSNNEILRNSNLYGNTCSVNEISVLCGTWNASSPLTAYSTNFGYVDVGTDNNNSCYVLAGGIFTCI